MSSAHAIAVPKVVPFFFMHLRYRSRLSPLVLFAGLGWGAIPIALTVSDYMSRPWPITPAS